MKKIFRNILLSALTITAVASCADDRNNFLPDDSFGFNNKAGENVVTLPLYGGSYNVNVIKSGKGLNEGVVNITTSNFDLNHYNKQYGVEYIPLPTDMDLYSFSTESLAFGTDDVTKSFTISWVTLNLRPPAVSSMPDLLFGLVNVARRLWPMLLAAKLAL